MRASHYMGALFLLVTAGAWPAAQAQAVPPLPPVLPAVPAPAAPDNYRLAIGDTLSIVVEGEDLFTRECQVNGTGTISYPKLGDVPAAGSTCEQLRLRLDQGLRAYLKRPHVMVTVRQYGQTGMSVFVMGEVTKPGPYPLAHGAGFLQALAAAGGPTEAASGQLSLLKVRTGQSITFRLDDAASGASGLTLEPGDVLLVLRKGDARYAVLGEVAKPGMFDMPVRGEVRVLDAVQQAGVLPPPPTGESASGKARDLLNDPMRAADLEHARLSRAGKDTPLDLAALLRGDTTQNLVLQAGDTLTIPRRPMLRAFVSGEVRLPGVQTLPQGATVLDLLNACGGPATNARPSQAKLLRLVDGKTTAQPINVGDLLGRGDLRQNQVLKDGDVLFIPPQRNANPAWNAALSALSLLTRLAW